MDFFESQRVAQRKTHILVVSYFFVVVVLIPLVYLPVVWLSMGWHSIINWFGEVADVNRTFTPTPHPGFWYPQLFGWVALVTIMIVVGATFYRILVLSQGGGRAVARMLGGQRVSPDSGMVNEQRVLHVVEEMAIASGMPVPDVYVMPGALGINAFAAGLSYEDAVIGITGEAVKQLTRDQLQGVMAHEFSHILSGDIRLKMAVLGVLSGMRILDTFWSAATAHWGAIAVAAFLLLAPVTIPLALVSQAAVLLARLIQGALSRQREYAADASAVQFTRNSDGLCGALKTIGGLAAHGRILGVYAGLTNHFFVVNALGSFGGRWTPFESHPPLEKRVRRLDPRFDGQFRTVLSTRASQKTHDLSTDTATGSEALQSISIVPEEVIAQIGLPGPEHLLHAVTILAAMPDEMRGCLRTPSGCMGIVYALLLHADRGVRHQQLIELKELAAPAVFDATVRLQELRGTVAPDQLLPMMQMVIRTLRGLKKDQYVAFVETVNNIVSEDDHVDLLEFGIQRMTLRHLESMFVKHPLTAQECHSMELLRPAVGALLSCLAYWGANEGLSPAEAFRKGMAVVDPGRSVSITEESDCGAELLVQSLMTLGSADGELKRKILTAHATCAGADGQVTIQETQFLQIVADALDCPMPPVLPSPHAPEEKPSATSSTPQDIS